MPYPGVPREGEQSRTRAGGGRERLYTQGAQGRERKASEASSRDHATSPFCAGVGRPFRCLRDRAYSNPVGRLRGRDKVCKHTHQPGRWVGVKAQTPSFPICSCVRSANIEIGLERVATRLQQVRYRNVELLPLLAGNRATCFYKKSVGAGGSARGPTRCARVLG